MTNHGVRAILALPKMPVSELRLLVALETVPADAAGRRVIGMLPLAAQAGLCCGTACAARDRLVARGLVEHRLTTWQSPPDVATLADTWRLLFPIEAAGSR